MGILRQREDFPPPAVSCSMSSDPVHNPYAPPAVHAAVPQGGAVERGAYGAYPDERRSVPLLILLTVITLGIYPSVWIVRRRRFLDSLDSTEKLGGLAAAPLVATLVSFVLGFVGLPPEIDRAVSLGLGAVSIITAFRIAKILRSDFARTGRPLKVSGVGTFFFNALYLQYKINQAADTPARLPSRF
jgi:hypothetical protein